MPRKHGEPTIAALPSLFPEGWLFVARKRDVIRQTLIHKT